MTRLFIQDVVALKANRTIRGIIYSTWRDSESLEHELIREDCIYHNEVPWSVFDETFAKGKPPEGYVVIGFPTLGWGRTVISEESLVLVNRALFVGDIVKSDVHAVESGTVTKAKIKCRIQPIYSDLPYQTSETWPHEVEDNELWVPSEELRFDDFQPGDYIAYKQWIGEIIDVWQDVTVVLPNRHVVTVKSSDELSTPIWSSALNTHAVKTASLSTSLEESIQNVKEKLAATTNADAMQPTLDFHAGLKVHTKKGNLRLGHWIHGRYLPSVTPRGTIVDCPVNGMQVDWVTTNIFDKEAMSKSPPEEMLQTHDITAVRLCSTQLPQSPYGSRIAREMMVGDLCRFYNDAEAEAKYTEGASGGFFRRIPRTLTQGYNMNIFNVVESDTEIEVEWQNGSRTWQNANSLVPYPTVDDHDLWPGEVVSVRESQTEQEGLIRATKLGIVQSVDAADRVAEVRWFKQPRVQCFAGEQTLLVPGSKCGELSDEITSASLYELSIYHALSRKRGDVVLIRPSDPGDTVSDQRSIDMFSRLRARIFGSADPEAGQSAQTNTDEFLWVGEVVNVGHDGKLTVRLGALQPPRDVEISVDEAHLLLSPDDEDDTAPPTDEEMEDVSDSVTVSDNDAASTGTIEETIEYEGGARLDDGGEDAWMTDDSGSGESQGVGEASAEEVHEPETHVSNGANASTEDIPETSSAQKQVPVPEITERTSSEGEQEYRFNELDTMPSQFEILDEEPPDDHHFKSHLHSWSNPGMLRRIRKEHKLLRSSLPPGIWVRTWADRLDLLRVLIVGPRNTPYALAPFVLDFAFGNGYPKGPPEAYFHSWTGGLGKINPNLYEDGTVCLSILGTWPESHDNEAWNQERSSILQVVVSLLGLVLVERPYYNEAGFEDMAGKDESLVGDRIYSERALVLAKGFVVRALSHHVPGVADVIRWVYRDARGPRLIDTVVREAHTLKRRQAEAETTAAAAAETSTATATTTSTDGGRPKLSKGALMLLDRYLPALEKMVAEE